MRLYGDQNQTLPRRATKLFPKFTEVFDLDLRDVITKLVMALQGDDDADAGKPSDLVAEDMEWEETDLAIIEGPGADLPVGGGMGMEWGILKQSVNS